MSRDKSLSRLVYVRVLQPKSHVAGCPIEMGYKMRQTATVYRIDTLLLVCTTSATVSATDRKTDTILESSYGNMSTHKKFQLKAQNKGIAVDRYMHSRMTGMHK